jgi:hypothetical protein
MATAVPGATDPTSQAIIQAGNAYQAKIISWVNNSGLAGTVLGEWITSLQGGSLAGPAQQVGKWIFGYKYTSGDYALGEVFIDRVLGHATTSRWNTPDELVPVSWAWMTALFGLPIAVNTDLDTLSNSGSLSDYLNGRPEQKGYVTQAQVTRAHQLMQTIVGYPRVGGWATPDIFFLLPYAAPIPDPRTPNALYNGTLPTGQQVQNGILVTKSSTGDSAVIQQAPPPVIPPVTPPKKMQPKTVLLIAIIGVVLLATVLILKSKK